MVEFKCNFRYLSLQHDSLYWDKKFLALRFLTILSYSSSCIDFFSGFGSGSIYSGPSYSFHRISITSCIILFFTASVATWSELMLPINFYKIFSLCPSCDACCTSSRTGSLKIGYRFISVANLNFSMCCVCLSMKL